MAFGLIATAGSLLLLRDKTDAAPGVPDKSAPKPFSKKRAATPPTATHGQWNSEEDGARQEALVERGQMTALLLQRASASFAETRKHVVEDLALDAWQSGQVEKIFARREKELADLLARETAVEDGREITGRIVALIRHKGLREDLAGVVSREQLEAFEAREANRQRDTVEARVYRDMAEISAVVQLTDPQKQEVLGALMKHAREKVEKEADARALMSLHYGPMAADFDPYLLSGLSQIMGGESNLLLPNSENSQQAAKKKAAHIENELSALRGVLDEEQIARYREHLETQPSF